MFNLDFLRRSSLMGTTLRAMPSKSHAFYTNDHAFVAMPTWHKCAPPILFWHWPPFNLFPSSCITWIFFVDSHWWVPLRVQYPTIYKPFRQIIRYILQCPHDVHVLVHLFCFDLHKCLLRSRASTCPTSELPAQDIPVPTGDWFCLNFGICWEIWAHFLRDYWFLIVGDVRFI